jgi:hypothetical protein
MFELDSEWHPSTMEINAETPIFHALTAGLSIGLSTGMPVDLTTDVSGAVSPYRLLDLDPIVADPFDSGSLDSGPLDSGPDELTEFHRDPLLAPIPFQVYVEQLFSAAHLAPTMIATPNNPSITPSTAPLPPTAGSSHGSALSMTSWMEQAVLDVNSEYGRHHRPVPALPCAFRW